jgi:hypothetical protein
LAFFRLESFLLSFRVLSNWGDFNAKMQSFYSLELFAKIAKLGFLLVFLVRAIPIAIGCKGDKVLFSAVLLGFY